MELSIISKKNDNGSEYDKGYMKIKFNTGEDIPLNKQLHFPTITVILEMFLKIMVNIIHKFILMIVCMKYKG